MQIDHHRLRKNVQTYFKKHIPEHIAIGALDDCTQVYLELTKGFHIQGKNPLKKVFDNLVPKLEKNTRSYRKFKDLFTSRNQQNQITHYYKQDTDDVLKQEPFDQMNHKNRGVLAKNEEDTQEIGIGKPDLLTLKEKLLKDHAVKKKEQQEANYSIETTKRLAGLEDELNALRKLHKSGHEQLQKIMGLGFCAIRQRFDKFDLGVDSRFYGIIGILGCETIELSTS